MKHPIVQSELGLITKPEVSVPTIQIEQPEKKLTRAESKYFYEGACFILHEMERVRDTQIRLHGENDYAVRFLSAILGPEWYVIARAMAYAQYIDVPEGQSEKKLPLELLGQND